MALAPTHYIVELLAPWGDVQLKRMFGGMGAYRDKLIFAIIDDGIVYFKVDDTTRGDYQAAQSEPFSYPHTDKDGNPGRMTMNGYWRVPDEILEEPGELAQWAEKAWRLSRDKPVKAKVVKGLPRFGKLSAKRMQDIGISSRKDLENVGAVEAYIRAKARFPKEVSVNLLWGLYAVLNGIDTRDITPDIKEHLKALLDSHTSG